MVMNLTNDDHRRLAEARRASGMYERARMPKITVHCFCGKPFETTQKRLDAGHGKYCSKVCMHQGRKKTVVTECHFCKKKMSIWPCELLERNFCSKKCFYTNGFSTETKKRMSELRSGRKFPERQGEACHFWRGGVTPINKKIRMSTEMRLWRKAVFERDGYTCVLCNAHGGLLHADHNKPFALYPDLRFSIENGRTLCVPCHRKTPTWGNVHYAKET